MSDGEVLSSEPPNTRMDGGGGSGADFSWDCAELLAYLLPLPVPLLVGREGPGSLCVPASPVTHSHTDPKEDVVFAEGTGAP